ncbi:MAG: hypothetical protein J7M25_08170 [Deltaproteobacteria bacterium]|nr:hypothetical protein [Deltaproteobacteria bacterium]
MRALFTLTPDESKRLIGRAVARVAEVRQALDTGVLVIAVGSTASQVARACSGQDVDESRFVAGIVARGVLCVTPRSERLPNMVLRRGKVVDLMPLEALELPDEPKVLVKGANAVDPSGMAGVMMAARDGGTVGRLLARFLANGWTVVTPVGYEKLIPSVLESARLLGIDRLERSIGARVGMMPLVGAKVITEREALATVAPVEVTAVAAGGLADSLGAVTFVVEGRKAEVDRALVEVESVKGTRLPAPVVMRCAECHHECDFRGKADDELPSYLVRG